MCGIAGFVNWTGEPASGRLMKAMTDRLAHRGPDGEGQRLFGSAAIGHRRLSIIDVSTGAQPMSNEDGTVWVTFNGEIYNFSELRTTLVEHGHVFRTHSDTEVIVHGYEEWGEDVVTRLRGIFAFGILDERRERLYLARDHFGVKPLVYYADDRRFSFGSELKALTVDPAASREIDWTAVADYFEYGYVPAPRTILRQYSKLMPGHTVTVDLRTRGPLTQRQYWRLRFDHEPYAGSEGAALEELSALMADSVRMELVSDVPLGAMLSGGLDSSAVVSFMAEQSPDPIKTFSIGFEEERFSEVQYARAVAEHVRSEHHEHIVRPNVASLLPRLVYHFDEPFSDASAVPTYYLCEMARRNVTVCLSGDGGDEMFAGYDRYGRCIDQGRFDFLPGALRRAVAPLATWYPTGWPGGSTLRALPLSPRDRFVEYMQNQYGRLSGDRLFSAASKARIGAGRRPFEYLRASFDPQIRDPLHAMLDVDVRTYLANDILAKVDITSMMNSLEVRVPLLDHRLAEFIARLPASLKLRDGQSKYAFKQVARPRLPAGILDRRKMGFGVPMREWVATELRDFTRRYLLEPSRASGVLDAAVLEQMVKDNETNLYRSRTGGKLWWALFFEIWYQDVYSAPAPPLA